MLRFKLIILTGISVTLLSGLGAEARGGHGGGARSSGARAASVSRATKNAGMADAYGSGSASNQNLPGSRLGRAADLMGAGDFSRKRNERDSALTNLRTQLSERGGNEKFNRLREMSEHTPGKFSKRAEERQNRLNRLQHTDTAANRTASLLLKNRVPSNAPTIGNANGTLRLSKLGSNQRRNWSQWGDKSGTTKNGGSYDVNRDYSYSKESGLTKTVETTGSTANGGSYDKTKSVTAGNGQGYSKSTDLTGSPANGGSYDKTKSVAGGNGQGYVKTTGRSYNKGSSENNLNDKPDSATGVK